MHTRAIFNVSPPFYWLNIHEYMIFRKCRTPLYHRLRGDMIEVYTILHGIYEMKVSPCLTIRSSETSRVLRGHNMYLLKERSRTKLRSASFTLRIVNSWNSLHTDVVNAPSVNSFKNRIDRFWSSQDIVYDYKAKLQYISRPSAIMYKKFYSDLAIEDLVPVST